MSAMKELYERYTEGVSILRTSTNSANDIRDWEKLNVKAYGDFDMMLLDDAILFDIYDEGVSDASSVLFRCRRCDTTHISTELQSHTVTVHESVQVFAVDLT